MYLNIVACNTAHTQLLHQLGVATFSETFAATNTAEDMEQYLTHDLGYDRIAAEVADIENTFFVVYADGKPAGYAKIRQSDPPPELAGQNAIEIERIYLLNAFQGLGVGKALMNHLLHLVTSMGYETVWLGVWEHNHKAIQFYERFGFVFFGSHLFMLGSDPQTDLLMYKVL